MTEEEGYDPPLHSSEGQAMLERMGEIAVRIEQELGTSNIDVLAEYRGWLDDTYDQDQIVDGGWPTELTMDSETVGAFIEAYDRKN